VKNRIGSNKELASDEFDLEEVLPKARTGGGRLELWLLRSDYNAELDSFPPPPAFTSSFAKATADESFTLPPPASRSSQAEDEAYISAIVYFL
jgi:hypothetical protein